MPKDFRRVLDINDVPAMRRMNGTKAINVSGSWAIAQFADGARWYYRGRPWDYWELVREEIFTNC